MKKLKQYYWGAAEKVIMVKDLRRALREQLRLVESERKNIPNDYARGMIDSTVNVLSATYEDKKKRGGGK